MNNRKPIHRSIRPPSVVANLRSFLSPASSVRTAWLKHSWGQVYVCKSKRYHGDMAEKLIDVIDVSNIGVYTKHRGQGHFTSFLTKLEELAGMPIYIENVTEERFMAFFVRRGYRCVTRDEAAHKKCYLWTPSQTNKPS